MTIGGFIILYEDSSRDSTILRFSVTIEFELQYNAMFYAQKKKKKIHYKNICDDNW